MLEGSQFSAPTIVVKASVVTGTCGSHDVGIQPLHKGGLEIISLACSGPAGVNGKYCMLLLHTLPMFVTIMADYTKHQNLAQTIMRAPYFSFLYSQK